jgi:hypothetical protein
MNEAPLQRLSIGGNPFASLRDVRVFIGTAAVVIFTIYVVLTQLSTPKKTIQVSMIAACIGMLPSLVATLPVCFRISQAQKRRLIAKLPDWRFGKDEETEDRLVFTPITPRWMRWDSNRVLFRSPDSEEVLVTVPLYLQRRLRKQEW